MKTSERLLDTGALILAVPVLVPIVTVLASLFIGDDGSFAHLWETRLPQYAGNTLLLLALTGLLAGLIGTAAAWIVASFELPFRRVLTVLLILPLAAPSYVIAYVYADFLSFAGPVQTALRETFGWGFGDYWFPAIRSLPGAAFILALTLYPYVFLLVLANLERQSGSLVQAARVLGAGRFELATRVTLPIARPALAGGLALVLMETVADFGVVEHFGVPTMTTGIYRTWLAMGERETALQLGAWLFLIVLILIVFEAAARRGDRFNLISPGNVSRAKLGTVQTLFCVALCLVPVVLGLLLPLTILVGYAISEGDPVLGRSFSDYVWNTTRVAATAAFICVFAALILTYAQRLRASPVRRTGIRIATLGYAVPGLLLAVGSLIPLAAADRWLADIARELGMTPRLFLTGSLAALVFVYVARYLTVAFNSVQAGLEQINPGLDAVARTLGESPTGVLRRVHAPILSPVLLYAGLLVFIDVAKELPATLVLRPFNFETLATRVYRLASDERLAEASTAAVVIVAVSLVPTLILALRGQTQRVS